MKATNVTPNHSGHTHRLATADNPMKIRVLAVPGALMSSVAVPVDVFQSAGTMWERVHFKPQTPLFDVQIVSVDGDPVKCIGGFTLQPSASMWDVDTADLVVIPGSMRNPALEKQWNNAVTWLQKMHQGGAHLASICTGAFLLAATGLLDGKSATTHWGAAEIFRSMYPQVKLDANRIITDEGNLFCSGGAQASTDLALFLIGRYAGLDMAEQCAKVLVHDMWRSSQVPYSPFYFQKDHGDQAVMKAQGILETDYASTLVIEDLAKRVGMTPRTFERRFKKATGDSPITYLQRVRVDQAKSCLSGSNESFEAITYLVGYEDASSFRRLFTRLVGSSPGRYREKFLGY